METRSIQSIGEYLSVIDDIAQRYSAGRMKESLLFRGLSIFEHRLIPGIYRAFGKQTATGEVMVPAFGDASEYEILNHFIKNAISVAEHINRDDLLTWLTYAQHFGVPTRLLDFSSNPLISLYFCCKREPESDGGVCILHEKNYVQSLGLNSSPNRKKGDVLAEIIRNIQDPAVSCTMYPVTFIPHYIDTRMEAQTSRFLVWGSDRSAFEDFARPHGSMLSGKPEAFFCKIRVPCEHKQKLLHELSFLGINEKRLFPGLDGIGKYVAAYYRITPYDR